jgi:hypothetical protein
LSSTKASMKKLAISTAMVFSAFSDIEGKPYKRTRLDHSNARCGFD